MKEKPSKEVIALLWGEDRPGIVARVAQWLYQRGSNILHADQHRDPVERIFFQRVQWEVSAGTDATAEVQAFTRMAHEELGMKTSCRLRDDWLRVALMVSKQDHCFHDLILRFHAGDMPGQLVGVVSNHDKLAEATAGYGLPFACLPVTAQTKPADEERQLAQLRQWQPDLVVMARYMQVLSGSFLESVGCPVINIHHSFLPAFAGGRPYHQAFARGVKLIGATAHYATEDLDEGPIIAQDVIRINHRHVPADLIRRGRDLEKVVLAQAVRWHLESRVLVYGNKTVVFD